MKPELNRKDQSKQNKLRKMLASGLPLSALLTGLLGSTAGCDFFTQTTGDMPNPETSSQSKPDMPGKTREEPLMGKMLPPEPKPLMGEPPPKPVIRGDMAPEPIYYDVRKGDTLYSIAKQHGMTVEKLKTLNGFSDKSASSLKAGQKIRIR